MTAEDLTPPCLRLSLPKSLFLLFIPLLQQGVEIRIQAGCSLSALLREQLGFPPEYVRDRIKTVFLEGKPVDDLEAATVRDGSVLALSAALPGLAGATLRRGGRFAALRSPITHRETGPVSHSGGFLKLKLFNLLLPELGPDILRRGIFLPREDLEKLLQRLEAEIPTGCLKAELEGRRMDEGEVRARKWLSLHPRFSLSVEFPP